MWGKDVLVSGRDAVRRARFEMWTTRLQAELRLRGARLVVEAAEPVMLESLPRLRISGKGAGGGTLTLRFGRRVTIGRDVELEVWAGGENCLEMGDYAFVMNSTQISLRGGSIRLGPHASLRTGSIVKSEGELILGEYAGISNFGIVHCADQITLEDYAGTADRVTIVDSEKMIDGSDTYFLDQPLITAPVVLERNVFVASNAVITAGTRVGRNSVVAAGAVLTGKTYPAGWIIGGLPAKPLRPLPKTETADRATTA